jgi:hypothetical protein
MPKIGLEHKKITNKALNSVYEANVTLDEEN